MMVLCTDRVTARGRVAFVPLNVRVDEAVLARYNELARLTGSDRSEWIRYALSAGLPAIENLIQMAELFHAGQEKEAMTVWQGMVAEASGLVERMADATTLEELAALDQGEGEESEDEPEA